MQTEFTEADRLAILRLVNEGDDSVLGTESMIRFCGLYHSAVKRMESRLTAVKRENASLKGRLSRFEKKENELFAAGEFDGKGLDSVLVARALLFCLQHFCSLEPRFQYISMQKLQILLYDVYAYYLANKKMRLTVEGPVAYGYMESSTGKVIEEGPRFWRVKNALENMLKAKTPASKDDYETLKSLDPDAAGICYGVARKHYSDTDANLFRWIRGSEPYRLASRENNGGKWGAAYPDAAIYAWKSEQININEHKKS